VAENYQSLVRSKVCSGLHHVGNPFLAHDRGHSLSILAWSAHSIRPNPNLITKMGGVKCLVINKTTTGKYRREKKGWISG
jgi:hypothetical protein